MEMKATIMRLDEDAYNTYELDHNWAPRYVGASAGSAH